MRQLLTITLLLAAPAVWAQNGGPHVPDMEELFALELAGNPVISPDGRYILYTKQALDFENNTQLSQMWLASLEDGGHLQLTFGEKSAGNLTWSPDSASVAFTRDGKIHLMARAGGEASIADSDLKGIGDLQFSADGQYLYFIANQDREKEMKGRKDHLGDYQVVREEGTFRHLYRLSLDYEGEPEQITSGTDYSLSGYDVSPDGSRAVFAASDMPQLSALRSLDIYMADIEAKTAEKFLEMEGLEGSPLFSPDGSEVAFTSSQGFAYNAVLHKVPARGGAPVALSTSFDEDVNPIAWNGDGILFRGNQKTESHLFRLDSGNGNVRRLTDGGLMGFNFTASDNGRIIAYAAATGDQINEIYAGRPGAVKKLTDMSAQLENFILGTRELIQWQADDGTEIEGVLIKPADFDPNKKYPLFVVTHGGPTGTDRPSLNIGRFYPLDSWVGEGAIVLQTNYRGSAGYGEAFRRLNWRNLGVGPATDIIAGINHLVREGYIDEGRIGCLGWSQGGHISAMLATYSDRCTVAHMGAGISDWRTYYYNTDITLFTVEYFGKTPIEDDAVYAKTSPITYIDRAKTPVLIQHGENDQRVPIANAYQLRQALIDKGVETRMVVYNGMGHGPSTPKMRRAVMSHLDGWFRHHLFDAPKPDFIDPEVPEKEGMDKEE